MKFDAHLEGGWEQIIFKQEDEAYEDTMRFYKRSTPHGNVAKPSDLTYTEWKKLSREKQFEYVSLRKQINHPDITGPL